MAKEKNIIIVGSGGPSTTVERIINELGKDVIVISAEEAKDQGLDAFAPEPFKITALPKIDVPRQPKKSGKEKRRARREQERKTKKCK